MKLITESTGVYLVPRNGTIESVTPSDYDDLRRLRTELEILRRLARSAPSMTLTLPPQHTEKADLHRELFNALTDAANPVVEEVIALIDKQNPAVRKELFMSVINEETENIIQEAIESGVATPADEVGGRAKETTENAKSPDVPGDETRPAHGALDAPAEKALARAQKELAKAVESAKTDNPAIAPNAGAEETMTDVDESARPGKALEMSEQVAENGDATPTPEDPPGREDNAADLEARLDDCLAVESNDPLDLDAHEQPEDESPTTTPTTKPVAAAESDAALFAEYTADKAAAAVEEIERGIRKLADLLSNDVRLQWKQAQDAVVEVMEARAKAGALTREAAGMAREIARLKEEMEIARDDADIARREAKLMREDMLRAKQRAEDFAAAAMQCAQGM